MECKESQQWMSAYLDEELDPSTMVALSKHMTSCAACKKHYDELRQMQATLKLNSNRYAASDPLRDRVQSEINFHKKREKIGDLFSWNWLNVTAAAACSLTLALSAYLFLALPSESERLDQDIVASHYRSLLADHLFDVASSDKHTVKPWFTGKLDYSPPVYDFSAQGFALIGGRLDYIDQRTVAALVYRHNKHMMNVFIWPDKSHKEAPVKNVSVEGFHLLEWTHDHMAYRAVSDMSVQEMAHFRELLMAQAD